MYALYRKMLVALVASALVGVSPAAQAQEAEQSYSIDARAGLAFAAGGLSNLVDPGPAFGGGLSYQFHPNFGVRGDVDVAFLQESQDLAGQTLPPITSLHLNGGVQVVFDRPEHQDFPLTTIANLGLGVTQLTVDDTFTQGVSAAYNDFSHTYFSMNGGLKLGWQLSEMVNLFASGTTYLIFMHDKDTRVLTEDPNVALDADPFEMAWVVPVTLGARVTIR